MQVSADAGAGVVVRGLVHVLSAGTGAGVVVQGLVRVRTRRNSQVVTEGRNQGRNRSGLKWLGEGRKRGWKRRGSGVRIMVGFRHRLSRGAVPLRLARPLPSPAASNHTHPRNTADLEPGPKHRTIATPQPHGGPAIVSRETFHLPQAMGLHRDIFGNVS